MEVNQVNQNLADNLELKDKEKNNDNDYSDIFITIAKASIFALTFLLPVFFLPFNGTDIDFSKQALLVFFSFTSLVCLLIYFVIKQTVSIKKSLISLSLLVFFVVFAFSSFFSISSYDSLWGSSLKSQSLLTLFALLVFYFVTVNIFNKKNILVLLFFFFLSGFLISIIFILQYLLKINIFPFDFAKTPYFNPIGSASINPLAIWNAFLLVLILPLIFKAKGFFKILFSIFATSFFLTVLFINFKTAWITLLAGLSFLGAVLLSFIRSKKISVIFAVLLILLIFLSTLFVSIGNYKFLDFEIGISQPEVYPSVATSLSFFAKFSFKEFLLGSGPGTFSYVWDKYKPIEANQTNLWRLSFLTPISQIFSILIETGILGLLSFIFVIIISFYILFYLLKNNLLDSVVKANLGPKEPSFVLFDQAIFAIILSGFFTISFIFFIYPTNLSFWFSFFLLLSFVAILDNSQKDKEKQEIIVNFSVSSTKSLIVSFGIIIIFIFLCGLLINYGKNYFSDYFYIKGLEHLSRGNLDDSVLYLEKATRINPKFDIYFRDLSQVYLLQFKNILEKGDSDPQKIVSVGRDLVEKSIKSIKTATELNKNNVNNWMIQGVLYRSMIGVVEGGLDELAISAYQKAQEISPNNPNIPFEIGLTYLAKYDLMSKQNLPESKQYLELARQSFEKSIELKPDYDAANFQIAMVYVRESKIDDAIQKLESLKASLPLDPGLAFQLGVLYFNKNELEKSRLEFERAVLVDPNYSNARYFLGLVLDLQGKKDEAISQFEIVESLNPDNQEVKDILKNLREGKSANDLIKPPTQELPITNKNEGLKNNR